MRQTLRRRPAAPRALPWLVLAGHLLALLFIGQALRPHERGAAGHAAAPRWLRLLPEPRRPAPEPALQETRPSAATQRPPLATAPPAPRPPATSPTPPAEAISLPAAAPSTSAHPPEPPASTPLDLRLPPALRHTPPPAAALARDDPRANTPRLGSEERMAKTLGTDLTLRESVDPDGTRTFRRGSDCVVARPARESQLNPFNQGSRPTPRLVEKC